MDRPHAPRPSFLPAKPPRIASGLLVVAWLTLASVGLGVEAPPSEPILVTPRPVARVPEGLFEISGMTWMGEHRLLAHNDSGNAPVLQVINLKEPAKTREVRVEGAGNTDWEEIAQDEAFVYVADSGNNFGARKDLKILKIAKSGLLDARATPVETIDFHYPEQKTFVSSKQHNFDCEALVCRNGHLLLFTKHRTDGRTNLYTLPKEGGSHAATLCGEMDAGGYVTGASVNAAEDAIALLGYVYDEGDFLPFVILLHDFEGDEVFSGKITRLQFTLQGQMESICFGEGGKLYVSHESDGEHDQWVYELDVSPYLD